MSRNTLIWAILWIASLVLISFYGGPVSYGIVALLTLIPIVSLIYLIYIYFFFHMYQKVDSKWLVVDDTVPFYFTLVNDYKILFAGIRVKFFSDFSNISGLDEKTEYEFFPESGITLNTVITCKCRGEYEVGIKTVMIQDYFRLFCISYKNREPLKVMVRPKLVALDSLKKVDVILSKVESTFKDTDPDVLTRSYVPGDDIRHIHWGITAKSGELTIRKRIGNEQQGVGVILFTERISPQMSDYLPVENKMLEAVLALSMYLIKQKIPVSFCCEQSGVVVSNLNNIGEFDAFYDLISEIKFDAHCRSELIRERIREDKGFCDSQTVFLFSAGYSKELADVAYDYADRGTDVVIYYIGHELPAEMTAIGNARISVNYLHPLDNLMEVM